MTLIAPGICRHCPCTDERPCGYCRGVHGECCWTDRTRTVCSNPACIRAEAARVQAAKAAGAKPPSKYRGWGYGAIVDDKRRRERRLRKKGRAA